MNSFKKDCKTILEKVLRKKHQIFVFQDLALKKDIDSSLFEK